MEAVLEKKNETQAKEKEKTYIVKFQNIEAKGVPLEFSAGMPITRDIQSYVFRDGLIYNVTEKLMEHINSLSYPVYDNIPDPNYPGTGITRSMQVGVANRFILAPMVNKPGLVVHEHLREKLNHKVMPGALENAANMPDYMPKADDVVSKQELESLQIDNRNYARENHKKTEDIKDLVATVNRLKADIKNMKKEG